MASQEEEEEVESVRPCHALLLLSSSALPQPSLPSRCAEMLRGGRVSAQHAPFPPISYRQVPI